MRSLRIGLLALLPLFVVSCGDPEVKARELYNAALAAGRNENLTERERLLREITAVYPSTLVATDANKDLIDIEAIRKVQEAENQQKIELMQQTVGQLIGLIFITQDLYHEHAGQYAQSIDELIASGLIREDLVRPEPNDTEIRYDIIIKPQGVTYTVHATPNDAALYHFYARPGDGIRYHSGHPANENSPQFALKM